MARIYLDARNITANPAGVGRYARSLIPELAAGAPEHRFVVIRHASNQEPMFEGPNVREVFVPEDIDTPANFVLGARTLARVFAEHGPADLFHDLFHILPLGAGRLSPVVVTLHDFVWVDHARASQPNLLRAQTIRLFGRVAIPYALRAADHVISISEPTTRRACDFIAPGKITTIAHGVTPEFFEPVEPPGAALPALVERGVPYVVAIGNAKRYKNLELLVRAFGEYARRDARAHLVLVGPCECLSDAIARSGAGARIVRTGFLDDAELRAVLGHARMFVFPSLVEGFGLPILEAMAMGVPTAIADLEPMRSIGGDAALRFAPHDAHQLARHIARVLGDDALHASLEQKGRERAREFRWPKTAARTLEVYERVLRR